MLCTAQAVTESSSVQTSPPCTTPMGLYADSSGRQVNETRPSSTSETLEVEQSRDRRRRQLAALHGAQVVDAGHPQPLAGADHRVVPRHRPGPRLAPAGVGGARGSVRVIGSSPASRSGWGSAASGSGSSWRDGVLQPPGQQRVQHRHQRDAGVGEGVLEAGRVVLVGAALDHARLLEDLEPCRDPVAGGAGAAHDVGEPPAAHDDLADHQQRPPLADDLEGGGDGAGASRQLGERRKRSGHGW